MANLPEPNTHDTADAPAGPLPARRIRALQFVAVALIAAAIALLLRGLLTPATPSAATPAHRTMPGKLATATVAPTDPRVGHSAPNVTLRDLRDRPASLSSYRGSVVLLNFWYVSCPPCQIEMPALERAYLAHQAAGFKVVGIDVVDDTATITAFTRPLGITYPILRDIGERATLAYQVRATPSSFLLDRDGVIRAVYTGPINTTSFQQQLAALLASS